MISVAMTTYNGERYIKEQLESIINQTRKVDEIIIFDDCSKDKTVQIIREAIKETEIKIFLTVNEKNVGYIENFRRAIEKSTGDYIFLCDQDDVWMNDKVEKMLDIMEKYDIRVLFTQYDMIDSKGKKINAKEYRFNGEKKYGGKEIKKISLERLVFGNIVPGCTYCFTSDIKDYYMRIIERPIIHDYSIALIGACIGKSYYYNEKTIYYRIHNSNTIGIQKKSNKQKIKINKKRKKPYILEFLENYKDIIDKSEFLKISMILYLRLPLIKEYMKNIYISICNFK